MLECRLKGIRIRIYFGFFAVLIFYFYGTGCDTIAVSGALICCLLHETGHLAAMLMTGNRPSALCFYAGGIKIIPERGLIPRGTHTFILSAGCAVNLLLAGISFICGFFRPAYINTAIGLINLLPLSCLDGGRIAALYMPENRRRPLALVTVLPAVAAVYIIDQPAAVMLALFAAAAEFLMD